MQFEFSNSAVESGFQQLLCPDKLSETTVYISGDDHDAIAMAAVGAINRNASVVLVPSDCSILPSLSSSSAFSIRLNRNSTPEISALIHSENLTAPQSGLTLLTSGSTAAPKAVFFSRQQLELTASWYRDIYGLTQDSTILSSLPSTYNFSFIAGAWTAHMTGCRYHYAATDKMISSVRAATRTSEKVVVLANPVTLELMAQCEERNEALLIDTGGAPMSVYALMRLREQVGEIREGYGLTETCSLTHFDREGSSASQGTVGCAMRGVECQIRTNHEGKPELWIASPNLGIVLGGPMQETNRFYSSGDCGQIDSSGRLRVLGRISDWEVGGFYPRDTLDLIGPILGVRGALVQHTSAETIAVKLRRQGDLCLAPQIADLISEVLHIPASQITVQAQEGPLTHSMKLTRQIHGEKQ